MQALIGFSRLNPIEPAVSKENAERLVSVKQPETDWYPAYEVRGEGIFIEFDNDAISEWSKAHPEVQERVNILNTNYQKSYIGSIRSRIDFGEISFTSYNITSVDKAAEF